MVIKEITNLRFFSYKCLLMFFQFIYQNIYKMFGSKDKN